MNINLIEEQILDILEDLDYCAELKDASGDYEDVRKRRSLIKSIKEQLKTQNREEYVTNLERNNMQELNKLNNDELLMLFMHTVEDAYYHHLTDDQEEARRELPIIKAEVLKRMK